MANSPRPGVIQLEHPNVYQAAKQAQQDDWIRQGLKTAGDLIADRNKDIRYNKARGKQEDRRTSKEAIADTASSAWEGIKSGAGAAWDLLKAPFTEEASEESVPRSLEGEMLSAPILETPGEKEAEDPLAGGMSRDRGMSLVAPDQGMSLMAPGEISQAGERVSFPTTVVGEPSKPASQEQNAPAEGATGPAVASGMLQAPDYSEMYRLDPKRAEYDWGRERDLMTNETRQRTAGRNAQAWRAANAEHDIPIRQEMEEKAIRLFEDVRSGALDKNSSDYVSRRGELGLLNAKLYTPYNKTSFDKLLSEGVVDRTLELREEGMDLDRDKEQQRILENTSKFAESAGKQIMSGYSDLLKKIETRATMLESFREGTLEAIASKSSATFAAALKSLIQSMDNSVVMAKEWGPFQNASYLDRAKAWLEKQSNNTTFSGEEMRQAWVTAKAWAASTKTVVAQAQDTAVDQAVNYPGLRRQNIDPKEVYSYVDAALEAYVPKSDFSVEPKWPAVLDMSSPTLREGAGAVSDLRADPKGDAGLPVDPMAVVPKKKKQSAPTVPMATEDDLW